MAILTIKEIVGMSAEDREQRLVELRAELARIRTMVNAGGAVEDPTRIRGLRKAIAQVLTVQHEFKLGIRKVEETEKKQEKPAKKPKAEKKPEEKSPQ